MRQAPSQSYLKNFHFTSTFSISGQYPESVSGIYFFHRLQFLGTFLQKKQQNGTNLEMQSTMTLHQTGYVMETINVQKPRTFAVSGRTRAYIRTRCCTMFVDHTTVEIGHFPGRKYPISYSVVMAKDIQSRHNVPKKYPEPFFAIL